MRGRLTSAVVAAAIVALATAAAALADREQVKLTKTGEKAAKVAVVRRADLAVPKSWTGATKRPTLGWATSCPGFRPKQHDLVVVGAAEHVWQRGAMEHDSEAQVLRTRRMVVTDWKRTVRKPQVLGCLSHNVRTSLTASERLSYVTRLPLPHLAALARLYRTVITVHTKKGKTAVVVDAMLIGVRRTEITLTTTALYTQRKAVTRAELRLARILIHRAR
jgi:hypothetical protein